MSKHPLTIADFKKGWDMVLQKEEENNQFPIHAFGSFRHVSRDGMHYCRLCRRTLEKQNHFFYSKLCFGKRKYWIGRKKCPSTPHFHVRCSICHASWLESQEFKTP